jgi:iron complex outermembrane receptor protein
VFGEASLNGTSGAHTWVGGAAWQVDAYRSQDVSRFDYTYSVPGVFAQDDIVFNEAVTVSGSARVDAHSDHGAFLSPRVSTLIRPADAWTVRLSAGRGYFAPSPFTEDTEATGLVPLAPLGTLEPERADSLSGDLTWTGGGLEVTGTLFYSRIRDALTVVETGAPAFPIALVNAAGPTRTHGTEFLARYHAGELDVILSHMYLRSTEPDNGGRREVPLNPRHLAGLDILWQVGPVRTGIELFYTGRQALEDNPYRDEGSPYLLWGALVDVKLSARLRAYVNAENLGDVRQTKDDPLIRRVRDAAGRWTIDAWAPLEGRTVNAGVRVMF